MDDHHFKEGISSVDPLGHDSLEEVLSGEDLLFGGELKSKSVEHLVSDFHVSFHHSVGQLDDGLHDEGDEGSLQLLSVSGSTVGSPALSFSVEVVLSPESLLQLKGLDLELGGVDTGELGKSEGPAFLS